MLASLSNSTLKQYNTTYSKWWRFCKGNSGVMFHPNTDTFLSFLKIEFSNGARYSTLNTHRSALNLICHTDNSEIIERFMKGVFKLRPHFPKYEDTWDPEPVLKYISTLKISDNITLENLTLKMILLLALCSAHRVQTFSKIRISNVLICEEGIDIKFSDLLKTSGPRKPQPHLKFPFFRENSDLCLASVIIYYINSTKSIRGNEDFLILTIKKPHRPATTQTLSRWIKKGLSNSGIDVKKFKAHSTRSAASSAALRVGTSTDTIRKAAGWSHKSQTFNKFYNKPLCSNDFFANYIKKLSP